MMRLDNVVAVAPFDPGSPPCVALSAMNCPRRSALGVNRPLV